MAFEFRLPDIGEGLSEAEVIEWLVDVGEMVELDQPLVRVETDKAVTDIPSPKGGVLLVQGASAGSTVEVGELLAVIGQAGEEVSEGGSATPIVGTLQEPDEAAPEAVAPGAPAEGAGRARALPLVRKIADERGVDLDSIQGTGPKGRITREDVERAAAEPGATDARLQEGTEARVRLSRLRRTIAEHMSRSWREIPHVTTFGEADATGLLAARRKIFEARGASIPMEALFITAVIPALQAHPEFNASLDGEELVLKRRYDVGVAVDTPDGLIVPVVRGADGLDLVALAGEVDRLSGAARNRTITSGELAGATFTITNIGAVGGGHGTPIIPYGTTAILSFGRAREQPVARRGQVEVVPLLPLSLSYDHRVIDGALGRRFLRLVIDQLERIGG
jgi:pyruvate dehydrogenase E2 component (dihydrolipoamide acetyltransferase)